MKFNEKTWKVFFKELLTFEIVISILFTSCTSTKMITEDNKTELYEEIEHKSQKMEGQIILENKTYTAENITFFSDSITWPEHHEIKQPMIYNGKNAYVIKTITRTKTINTSDILEIQYVNKGKAAGEGFLMGILFGGISGFIFGYSQGDTDLISAEASGIIGIFIFGIPVGILGGIIGGSKGSKQRYIFKEN